MEGRITRVLIVLGLAAFAAGCATNARWVNNYDPTRSFDFDRAQCEYQIEMGYTPQSTPTPANASTGYIVGASLGDAIANGLRKQQLMGMCLRARGWTQEEITATTQQPTASPTVRAVSSTTTAPSGNVVQAYQRPPPKVWSEEEARCECNRMLKDGELRKGVTIDKCIDSLCK